MDSPDARESWLKVIERESAIGGRFVRVQRLGNVGGNGTFSLVFAAYDNDTGREVCLKFFNPTMHGEQYRVECFQRESDVMQLLNGEPGILPLVQPRQAHELLLKTADDLSLPFTVPYIATGLAAGDLQHHIDDDKAQLIRDLRLFRAVCRALQRMHKRHVAHRDLKPENVFLSRSGEVWVGDFGSARLLEKDTPPLRQQYGVMWRGDATYTAPEFFCGFGTRERDFYSGDKFGLGAILFEMLTGSVLTHHIYGKDFHWELASHFREIPQTARESVFVELLPTIASTYPLPNLADFPTRIPPVVLPRLDTLYKKLAALDYR